jgi:hypothetical protein
MRPNLKLRRPKAAFLAIVAVGLLVPTAALAAHRFNDVPNDNIFHEDISAIAEAGVTIGCNPPDNDLYCPEDYVTRQQMAAFMNRLGALGDGKTPVVNAAELDGRTADEFVRAHHEPVSLVEASMNFDLAGGEAAECASVTTPDMEPDFSAIHQLHATPDGIDPWDINVSLDTRGMDDGEYDVCFASLDGTTPLPAGTYSTFAVLTLP